MLKIATIVEGQGEVEALPILLRRIAQRLCPECVLDIPRPIRVPRQAALSAVFDLDAARNAPSFDKLWRDVASLLEG